MHFRPPSSWLPCRYRATSGSCLPFVCSKRERTKGRDRELLRGTQACLSLERFLRSKIPDRRVPVSNSQLKRYAKPRQLTAIPCITRFVLSRNSKSCFERVEWRSGEADWGMRVCRLTGGYRSAGERVPLPGCDVTIFTSKAFQALAHRGQHLVRRSLLQPHFC